MQRRSLAHGTMKDLIGYLGFYQDLLILQVVSFECEVKASRPRQRALIVLYFDGLSLSRLRIQMILD